MGTARINGVHLHYELFGEGRPVVLTSGGRSGWKQLELLASALASRFRVLVWDRRNAGASDVSIGGDGSESDLGLTDLRALLQRLDMSPAFAGGLSWGSGLALLLAIHHPEDVRGLLLGWPGGGSTDATLRINAGLYGQYIDAANSGGMPAVAATQYFAERIAANPRNRGLLLAMDPAAFCSTMSRWRRLNTEGAPNLLLRAPQMS